MALNRKLHISKGRSAKMEERLKKLSRMQHRKTNMWKLNDKLLNSQWVTEEIKEKNKKTPREK